MLHFHFHHPDERFPITRRAADPREAAGRRAGLRRTSGVPGASLENLGNLYNSMNRPSDAVADLERCRDIRAGMVARNPGNSEMQSALGGSLHNLAMSYEGLGREGDAERLYREAIGHQRIAREAQPGHMVYRVFLTNHLMSLGDLLRRGGKLDEAAKLAQEGAGLWPRNPQQLLRRTLAGGMQRVCVRIGRRARGQGAAGTASARRAVETLTKAFDGGFRDASFYRTAPQLEPIRGRDDFQALLRRLDSPSGAVAK